MSELPAIALRGTLVRLTALDPDRDAESFARWSRDSEYLRFQDEVIARPASRSRMGVRLAEESDAAGFMFVIRPLTGENALGHAALWPSWPHGDAWLSVGIGDQAYWNKGYGTEAVTLTLRYGFLELNLQRISLTVLEGNGRAIRAYEKAGLVREGVLRENSLYDGRRHGEVFMGILKQEWESAQKAAG